MNTYRSNSSGGSLVAEPRPEVPAKLVAVESDGQLLPGSLVMPRRAKGLVVFAHGSGSDYYSPRNQLVARRLVGEGLGALLFNLLSAAESRADAMGGMNRFDIGLLTRRLVGAMRWLDRQRDVRPCGRGFFGASTGAAAALAAAAELGRSVQAVVARGGRPDLAGPALVHVKAPTLLIVGERDYEVLRLNREAATKLGGPHELAIVPEANHLFEEPGALETVATLAANWFTHHLVPR